MRIDNVTDILDTDHIESLDYETPYFLISKDRIRHQAKEYQKAFPYVSIHYAMKANFEPEVLETVHDAGLGFEVASKYELDMLKEIDVSPEKIIYGTSIKPIDHVKDAYEYGVRTFTCDCFIELHKIAVFAPGSKVYFRLRVDNRKSGIDLSEKFGTDPEDIISLVRVAKTLGLDAHGISYHVGSQSKDPISWSSNLETVKNIISTLQKEHIDIPSINIGGGYPCAYMADNTSVPINDIAEHILDTCDQLGLSQKIVMEPGRGLISETAAAVASVIGMKTIGKTEWIFLDLGVYNGLFEAMAYQGSTRYRCESVRRDTDEMKRFALSGPSGDGPDIIDREVLLPKDVKIGDKIIIRDVGAYSLVATSPFNGFPKPCVYVI